MTKDIFTSLNYAKRKLKEYKRLLSMNELLRYSSTTEEIDILMNSSESLLKDLEDHFQKKLDKQNKDEIEFSDQIMDKVNLLNKNIEIISRNLAKISLSILSADDLYLE